MNILIANDHGAVALKFRLVQWLEDQGYHVTNLGVDTEDRVDYPDQAARAVKEYQKGGYDLGIVCCGTGIGVQLQQTGLRAYAARSSTIPSPHEWPESITMPIFSRSVAALIIKSLWNKSSAPF